MLICATVMYTLQKAEKSNRDVSIQVDYDPLAREEMLTTKDADARFQK